MLISALNDYYDVLVQQEKNLPLEYSKVNAHCMVSLTPEGEVSNIIDYQLYETVQQKNGKSKNVAKPRIVVLPRRTEKTAIDSNIVEHRPLYLFGLEYDKKNKIFKFGEKGSKPYKSHQEFVKVSKEFFTGIDSAIAKAFLNFLKNWNPEKETNNKFINGLGAKYGVLGYVFCLEGDLTHPLHKDPFVKQKWEELFRSKQNLSGDLVSAQCSICGEQTTIARTHDKIKRLSSAGGMGTGGVLIGYKEEAYRSYGNTDSYNSQVSEVVMKHYTEALNFLLQSPKNHTTLDETMIVYWTADGSSQADNMISMFLAPSAENGKLSDEMLTNLMKDAKEGDVIRERISSLDNINPYSTFFIVGMKPNASRIAIKFLYRRRYGEVLENIARHQLDLKVLFSGKPVSLWQIKKELISPKSVNEKVSPFLIEGILHSMICGVAYPVALLQTILLRIRRDVDIGISYNRAAIVKACVNRILRNSRKEELTVGLNENNTSEAYLCGRLFAVLQRIQERSVFPATLNRTIKDGYFSSASVKPAAVFPKLLRLSQNHMKKISKKQYYEILVQEIIGQLKGSFPEILPLVEQGQFMIGYYQQYKDFFEKKDNGTVKKENMKEEE